MGCLKIIEDQEVTRIGKNHFFMGKPYEKNPASSKKRSNYYPFGLTFNGYEKAGMIDQKYKFNGKEEIGDLGLNWYDYGARMYAPDLGRWNRIDNKADEYTILSPYVYAGNNPVMMIDPDGNDIVVIGDQQYRSMVRKRLMNLAQTPEGARLVESLRSAEHLTVIHYGGSNNNTRHSSGKTVTGKNASWVYFDPESNGTVSGVERTAETSLAHELRHSEQDFDGTNPTRDADGIIESDFPKYTDPDGNSVNVNEIDAVNNTENPVRASMGLDIRESYGKVGTINLSVNGNSVTVGKNDYSKVTGRAATKAFRKIMKSAISGDINVTSLVSQFAKHDRFKKNKRSDNTKFKKDDKAETYD